MAIDLDQLKARSALAEIQGLTADSLALLEDEARELLEGELGRRLTLDVEDVAVTVRGDGLSLLRLPEHCAQMSSVVSAGLGDVTQSCRLVGGGWLVEATGSLSPDGIFTYPARHFGAGVPVTVTGRFGLEPEGRLLRVLMDVVEALAVRRLDLVSRRDQLSPWGSVRDGSLSADRDSQHRAATLENLLPYDLRARLRGYHRPSIAALI